MNNTIKIFLVLMVAVLGIGFAVDRFSGKDDSDISNQIKEDDLLVDEEFNNLFTGAKESLNKDNIDEFIKMGDGDLDKMAEKIVENTETKKTQKIEKKVEVIEKEERKIKIYSNQWNFSKVEFLSDDDVVSEINNSNYIRDISQNQTGEKVVRVAILSKNKKYLAITKRLITPFSDWEGKDLDVRIYDIEGNYLWGAKNRTVGVLSNNGLFFFEVGNGLDSADYVYVTRKIGKDIKIDGAFYGLKNDIVHYSNGGVMFKTAKGDFISDEVTSIVENTLGRTGNLAKGKLFKNKEENNTNKTVSDSSFTKKYYLKGEEVSKKIHDYYENHKIFAELSVYIDGKKLKEEYVDNQGYSVSGRIYKKYGEKIKLSWIIPHAKVCRLFGSHMPTKDGVNINDMEELKDNGIVNIFAETLNGDKRSSYKIGLSCSFPGIEDDKGYRYEYELNLLIPITIIE